MIVMKFKEGNRVEVLRRNEDPCGSWFPAKLLSKDEYRYTVRFEFFLTVEGDHVLEKVPEEDIRPCPPPVTGEERWITGDTAEVFDLRSWRVGKVAKVPRNNYFVIRLFGSIQLKEFHSSSLRVRQAWHNNQWFMVGKFDGKKQYEEACIRESGEQDPMGTFPTVRIVKKTLKSHYNPFPGGHITRTGKKRKAISNVGECHRLAKRPLTRKVDAASFPNDVNCMLISTRLIKSSEMEVVSGNTNDHAMHSYSIPFQVIEENDECSVGSCSVNNLPEYPIRGNRKPSREIVGSFSDDAMSSCPSKSWKKNLHTSEGELAADVHELELCAYRSTMEVLYNSGPLSWEQESLLTNLRLSLHISIEEHLFQLRHLLSA